MNGIYNTRMSREHGVFTPLPEANTDRIRTNVSLPFSMQDNIGIDLNKVTSAMQLVGIRHLKIETFQGDTSKANLQITSFNDRGEATAGAAKSQTVPQIDSNGSSPDEHWLSQVKWLDLTIRLNTEEAKRRILEAGGVVNRPDEWSRLLNDGVKSELRSKAFRHQFELNYLQFLYTALPIVFNLDEFVKANSIEEGALNFISNVALLSAFYTFLDILFSRGDIEGPGHGRRLSLTTAPQIDRLALMYWKSRGDLVKTLEE